MSDHFLFFVPSDPSYVPSVEAQTRATELVRTRLRNADAVKSEQNTGIQFYDCGSNFERVSCPHCLAEVSLQWWQEVMDKDCDAGGFGLAQYALPCCHRTSNLNQLRYDWPQAFGRYVISVMNPNIRAVPESLLVDLEASLNCCVVVVRQRI